MQHVKSKDIIKPTGHRKMAKLICYLFCVTIIILLDSSAMSIAYSYNSYQGTIECTAKYQPVHPNSLQDIQEAVKHAISKNTTVKALGNCHSISDSICTSGVPIFMQNVNHFRYNEATKTAAVGAGLQISTFLENLMQHNRSVYGAPAYTGLTLGGCIANGAHGTGLKHPSTLSQQIVSIKFVDGLGNVRKLTKDDKHFKSLQVNLGLLGIVFEIEFLTHPLNKLRIHHVVQSDKVVDTQTLTSLAQNHDHFQLWWYPSYRKFVIEIGDHVAVSEVGDCRANYEVPTFILGSTSILVEYLQAFRASVGLYAIEILSMLRRYQSFPVIGSSLVQSDLKTSCLGEGFATGYSHRITSFVCNECMWDEQYYQLKIDDSAIAIPIENLEPALKMLGRVFDQWPAYTGSGIWVRFLSAGDAYMGLNEGPGDWAVIEWISYQRWNAFISPKYGLSTFQLIAQVLVHEFGGRPHWAKNGLYYSSSEVIKKSHPNSSQFVRAMLEYDPNGLFMNDFGTRIQYQWNNFTTTAELSRHCALTDLCICQTNKDCGTDGLLEHKCGQFDGYPNYNICIPASLDRLCSENILLKLRQPPPVFVTPTLLLILLALITVQLKNH